MEIITAILIVFSLALLWLNFLASLAIRHDHILEKVQVIGQLLFVWLIPYFGAVFVLKLVYEHSPEAIPKAWIPWPFKNIVFGVPIRNRGGEGGIEIEPTGSRSNSNRDNHSDSGGDSGGGGGGGD